jgi:hypothetical protein
MYITTRSIEGDTLMACGDCGHATSMNKICKTPIQSATDMLKHMAAHRASRAFVPVVPVVPITQKLVEAVRGLGDKWASAQWSMSYESS